MNENQEISKKGGKTGEKEFGNQGMLRDVKIAPRGLEGN